MAYRSGWRSGCIQPALVVLVLVTAAFSKPAHSAACDSELLRRIPPRPRQAITGKEFVAQARALSGLDRDAAIRTELLEVNLPDFLRHVVPVTLYASTSSHATAVTVCVLPDYLAVGSDADFVLVPMGLEAALIVARQFGFDLPTPPVVDAIYRYSRVKLLPQPLPAGPQMRSTDYFAYHNELIAEQRDELGAPLGELTAGHKKDLVLTSRLWGIPGRVAIYGWHRDAQSPIQPLSTVHGERYSDYSHGVRLVSQWVFVDGVRHEMADVLATPSLARALTNEGALSHLSTRLDLLLRLQSKQ